MTEATSGPGKLLRAERESLGVTVREVADTLNLSITTVQALEADDYDRLPGTVFARGYIRAYARLLDLDPAPLLDLYPAQARGHDAHPVVHDAGVAEWIRRRPGLVLSLLGFAVAAGLVTLAVLIWPEEGIESLWRPIDTPTMTVPPVDAESSDWQWQDPVSREGSAAEPENERAVQEGATDAVGSAEANAGIAATAADESGTVPAGADPAVVEGASVVGSGGSVRRLTEAGDERLRLEFSADSWVEIRNAGGRVLYSNLNKADTVLELVGEGPFRILLGYAPGVTLAFEGEPVALAPHTRNNVATLVLGQ